jgi:hypothetical protein
LIEAAGWDGRRAKNPGGTGAKSPSKNDSIRKKSVYVDPRSHCLWLGFVIAAKYQSAGDGSSPVFHSPLKSSVLTWLKPIGHLSI